MTATVGEVKGQRIALLKNAVVTNVKTNDSVADKKELHSLVEAGLEEDEISVFDAGFRLA